MFESLLSYALLMVSLSPQLAWGQVINPSDTITVSNINVAPDGFDRPVIGVNGVHPGPLIKGNKGDSFDLNVVNNLDNPTMLRSTSIHWHGLFQKAVSDATLINGKGRSVNGDKTIPLSIVNVEADKKYRIRLVSLSCDPNYLFSIDNHKLLVIEADGQSTVPFEVDQIQIFAGQRYSFVLHANQDPGNYWVRARPNVGRNGLANTFTGGVNSAILRYAGIAPAEPTTAQPSTPLLLKETDLHPLENKAAPGTPGRGAADVNLRFNMALGAGGKFLINGTSYDPPSVPILLQIMSGARTPQDLLPAGSVYTLPRNKVVEVTFPGLNAAGPHPFHMHGHAFSVIRSAGSTADNYDDPVRRDVVNLGANSDEVTIRFTTDNPGPWFFHCHIEFHLTAGLAIVFAEDTESTSIENPVPEAWNQLCPIYDNLPPSLKEVQSVPVAP
ncbi:hypothetical protein MD484_g6746, partial [Candolleomyces efflorescens]